MTKLILTLAACSFLGAQPSAQATGNDPAPVVVAPTTVNTAALTAAPTLPTEPTATAKKRTRKKKAAAIPEPTNGPNPPCCKK